MKIRIFFFTENEDGKW